jgi:hypothetical protein
LLFHRFPLVSLVRPLVFGGFPPGVGQGYIIVLCLFVWCVILSEDCDFWWFQLEKEIEENEDEEDC